MLNLSHIADKNDTTNALKNIHFNYTIYFFKDDISRKIILNLSFMFRKFNTGCIYVMIIIYKLNCGRVTLDGKINYVDDSGTRNKHDSNQIDR